MGAEASIIDNVANMIGTIVNMMGTMANIVGAVATMMGTLVNVMGNAYHYLSKFKYSDFYKDIPRDFGKLTRIFWKIAKE